MITGKQKGALVIRSKGVRGELYAWMSIPVVGNDRIGYVRDRAARLGISERELCQRMLTELELIQYLCGIDHWRVVVRIAIDERLKENNSHIN